MKYIVTSDRPIWIKKTPELSGKNIGLVYKDTVIEVLGEINGYIKFDRGYILKNLDSISLVKTFAATTKLNTLASTANPMLTTYDTNVNNTLNEEKYDPYTAPDWEVPPANFYGGDNKSETTPTPDGNKQEVQKNQADQNSNTESIQDITVLHLDQLMAGDKLKSEMTRQSIRGIYGMPYQWMAHVDPRFTTASSTNITNPAGEQQYPGRIYTEKIIARAPILLISPGKPRYNATGGESIEDIIKKEMQVGTETLGKELQEGSSGMYYSFDYQLVQYFQYVNPILRLAARMLNIGDIELDGKKLIDYDWSQYYNKAIHGNNTYDSGESQISKDIDNKISSNSNYVGTRSIAFYLDSEFSISDSIGNNTMESGLKQLNSISDRVKEYQFLLGFGASGLGFSDIVAKKDKLIDDLTAKVGNQNGFLQTLFSSASTLLEGGKLMFPSLWQDSSFSRSYDVKFKFVSPDYDSYSWFLNIMVPLVHLICLTMPQKASNSFAYISPFLVRAFYKGMFNCDLGIITGLNISRGQETGWTQSGLPTIVEVSLSINDLYDGMAMSKSTIGGLSGAFALLKNPIYLDFIANMCGINLNEPDVRRVVSFYKILAKGAISDIAAVVEGNLMQWSYNYMMKIYGKMQRGGL